MNNKSPERTERHCLEMGDRREKLSGSFSPAVSDAGDCCVAGQ